MRICLDDPTASLRGGANAPQGADRRAPTGLAEVRPAAVGAHPLSPRACRRGSVLGVLRYADLVEVDELLFPAMPCTRCRHGSGEPSPGADVEGASPVWSRQMR